MKLIVLALFVSAAMPATGDDLGRLTTALRDSSALEKDLAYLNDAIGGRPTGSAANQRAVAWAESRLREIGVAVHREPFTMPARWLGAIGESDHPGHRRELCGARGRHAVLDGYGP